MAEKMTKTAEKTIDIMVEATFSVRFRRAITLAQFKELESGAIEIDDVVDESEPYRLASSEGEVEMDWDFAPGHRVAKKSKSPKLKAKS